MFLHVRHLAGLVPLWLDEMHTYWLLRTGVADLWDKLALDVHPPLYFLLTAWTAGPGNTDPAALRLVSSVAAGLLPPVMYWVARPLLSRAWSFACAASIAIHPFLNYYGFEARNYALLVVMAAIALGLVLRLSRPRAGVLPWVGLGAVVAVLLHTHNLAVFHVACLGVGGFAASGGDRWRFAVRFALACMPGLALYLPWFLRAVSAEGGVAWIGEFHWNGATRLAGPLVSAGLLGFGGDLPSHLRFGASIGGAPILGGVLTACCLAAAWPTGWTGKAHAGRERPLIVAWCAAGFLLVLFSYSWLRTPIYLPGRYDVVALGAITLLLATGAAALAAHTRRAWVGPLVFVVGCGLNVWSTVYFTARPHSAIDHFARSVNAVIPNAGPQDVMISVGLSYTTLVYQRDRLGLDWTVQAFPRSHEQVPGWYQASLFLRDRARFEAEADVLFEEITAHLRAGRRVWLLIGGTGREGQRELGQIIGRRADAAFEVDRRRSVPDLGVFALRGVRPTPPP